MTYGMFMHYLKLLGMSLYLSAHIFILLPVLFITIVYKRSHSTHSEVLGNISDSVFCCEMFLHPEKSLTLQECPLHVDWPMPLCT